MPQKELGWGWSRFSPAELLEDWWVLSRVKLDVDHQGPRSWRRNNSQSGDAQTWVKVTAGGGGGREEVGVSQEPVSAHKTGSFEDLLGTECEAILSQDHQVRNVLLSFFSYSLQS